MYLLSNWCPLSQISFLGHPNFQVLPKTLNIHDTVVGESFTFPITLYNYGSCFFTSKLYHLIYGMGDDFSGDKLDIDSSVVSLENIIVTICIHDT